MNELTEMEFYCNTDEERERFYDIFFMLCRKYHISWPSATGKERSFIAEVTRLTYAHDKSCRDGIEDIRPSFAS